jgi:hypothetical protein
MIVLRMIALLGLLLGVVGGCGGGRGGGSDGSQDSAPGAVCDPLDGGLVPDGATIGQITYRVIGGIIGGGDGTSLQIKPDGTLTRTTSQRGTEHGQLDPATLDDLVGKARAAQLPTLCLMYSCAGCGDMYSYEVSVQIDGITHTVQASMLADPLPDRLKAIIEALQAIVMRPLP